MGFDFNNGIWTSIGHFAQCVVYHLAPVVASTEFFGC